MTAPRPIDAVSCRVCGAAQAKPARPPTRFEPPVPRWVDVCDTCYRAFRRFSDRYEVVSGQDFVLWLARQLVLQSERKAQGDPIRKCEAMAAGSCTGYQCDRWAKSTRDGRHVCGHHAKTASVHFIDSDPIEHPLVGLVDALCDHDAAFLEALSRVVHRSRNGEQSDAYRSQRR